MDISLEILRNILTAWFDGGQYITASTDVYGDTRYVGLHGGHCSEVVSNTGKKDTLTVYQIDGGDSYLSAFITDHTSSLELIGMSGSGHDFIFELKRSYSECYTTIKMIK